MKIKAVFFDLDGTLIESKKDITQSVNDIRNDFQLLPLSEEEVISYVGKGTDYLLDHVLPAEFVSNESYNKFIEYYKINSLKYATLYHGVNELLDELGDYKKVLITNKAYSVTLELISKFFEGKFDLVYGGDSLAEKKPSPFPITYAMNELGLLPFQVIYFGDSLPDYKASIGAGVKCVMATYGYGTHKDLFACKEAEFVNTPLELLDIIDHLENSFELD